MIFLTLLCSTVALSEELSWRDQTGQPVQESESQKSKEDFGGWVLVTPDADWEEKWETPVDVTPHYSLTSSVSVGETIMLLIFYANPALDETEIAEVRCDLKMMRPSGTISIEIKDVECYRGPIVGDPHALRLSNGLLGFVGEEDDERGEWIADIVLTDVVRGVSLNLRTRFLLID